MLNCQGLKSEQTNLNFRGVKRWLVTKKNTKAQKES